MSETYSLPAEHKCHTLEAGHTVGPKMIKDVLDGHNIGANVLEVQGNWIYFIAGGEFYQLWFHDPVRLYAVYDQIRRRELSAFWNEEARMLRCPGPETGVMLTLTDSPTPCKRKWPPLSD